MRLKWGELKNAARDCGVTEQEIQGIDDAENPKEALAIVIMKRREARSNREPSPVHETTHLNNGVDVSNCVSVNEAYSNLRRNNKVVLTLTKVSPLIGIKDSFKAVAFGAVGKTSVLLSTS